MRSILLGVLIIPPVLTLAISLDSPEVPQVTDPYLNQAPPGLTPQVFGPGVVSSPEDGEYGIAVSPGGREIYFSRAFPDRAAIFATRLEGNGWTTPSEVEFSTGFFSMEPHMTPDGRRLYFFSERTSPDGRRRDGMWYVDRVSDRRWSEPSFFGDPPVSVARSGNLYTGGYRGTSPVVHPWIDGRYGEPRELDLGADPHECWSGHPFMAPDEGYILFDSERSGGLGGQDLWVCFRTPEGDWSEAVNPGAPLNTPEDDWIPSVTADGEYIFYSSGTDIYWVSSRILDGLREETLGLPGARGTRQAIRAPEFVRSPQNFPSVGAYELFLEDLDADGDTDAVISSFGASLVLLNDGSGHFRESWRRRTAHGLVVGDIDQDGDPDLVVSPYWHEGGICDVYLNDGRGDFEQVESKLCLGDGPAFMLVRLVDFDGDGDLDAVDYRADGMPVAWHNDGRGGFERSGLPIPRSAAFADLNGDGFADVLSRKGALELQCDPVPECSDIAWVPAEGDTGVRIYLNDREGRFESHAFLPLSPLAIRAHDHSWFIDVDNDGDKDVILTDGAGHPNPVGVLRNDGTGRLTEDGAGLATVDNGRIGAGDLNNDGYVDLVIANHQHPAQIWMNDGTGTFHDSGVRLGERFGSQSLGVADLDGDGDSDVFITDYRRPGTSVWFNQLNPESSSPQTNRGREG